MTVTATGGTGARALSTDQAITVTVYDVDEPPSAPAAPTVSAVDGSSDSLSVTWIAPGNSGKPDISSYDLQYRKDITGNFTDGPQDVNDTTTIIGGLDADSLYQVQVRATNDEGRRRLVAERQRHHERAGRVRDAADGTALERLPDGGRNRQRPIRIPSQ